ncbi:MAG: uroporphyrinogen-III synthase [Betaproteobacteria bacterium]|nr:MAG: uroporphyrinogen-III synthase [Betaproteobacteria bacterium]
MRSILITRPVDLAEGLAIGLRAAGITPLSLPLIEIAPAPQPLALAAALAQLAACPWAIFISPSAVRMGLAATRVTTPVWPASVRLAAIGAGTARALHNAINAPVLTPEQGADSESLLACPEMQAVAGQRVMLFRGEGGRATLAETLTARGARVVHAVCYARRALSPDPAALLARWQAGEIEAVSVTSTEIFVQLTRVLGDAGRALLQATPLFAPHERIAAAARAYGVQRVQVTAPGDAGLIAALTT